MDSLLKGALQVNLPEPLKASPPQPMISGLMLLINTLEISVMKTFNGRFYPKVPGSTTSSCILAAEATGGIRLLIFTVSELLDPKMVHGY